MFWNIIFSVFLLGLFSFLFIFPQTKTNKNDFNPDVSYEMVKKGALLIDARSPKEFSERHIHGAINIPHNIIKDKLSEIEKRLEGDKNKAIVVYCQSGNRSEIVKKELQKHGYKKVINHGGIDAWKK